MTPTRRYAWLKREIERLGATVVILDNRATLFDGDANVPGTATHALALLHDLAPPGGNVIVLAHVDKATARNGYSREGYSGTAAWHNRARWRWLLFQPNAQEDADAGEEPMMDDGRRILEVQKNNAGPVGARFALRIVGGAIIGDGVTGVVASIARDNERKAVLAAVRDAMQRKVDVPSNTGGPSTAYQALETMPSYPKDLRGRQGKKRLFRLLHQLRTDNVLEEVEFLGSGRHKRKGYRIVGESS